MKHELEKILKDLTPKDFLELALRYYNEKEELEKKLKENEGKVEFYETVMKSDDQIDMSEAAKILNIPGVGRNKLFEFLRDEKILRWNNQPYQRYVDCGYFKIIEQEFNDNYGNIRINLKTVIFQKGLAFIRKLWKDRNDE